MPKELKGFKNLKGNIVSILSRKKSETVEDFFKRMNERGYEEGDLEKVPQHWSGDGQQLHPGTSSADCLFCRKGKVEPSEDELKEQATAPASEEFPDNSVVKESSIIGEPYTDKDKTEEKEIDTQSGPLETEMDDQSTDPKRKVN